MHINVIALIGLLLIIAIAWWAISSLSLPPPIRMIVIVVIAVLCILWVASTFGLMPSGTISIGQTPAIHVMFPDV